METRMETLARIQGAGLWEPSLDELGRDWSGRWFRYAAVALTAGSAAIHVAVIREHLQEFFAAGVFFAVAAAIQAAWGVAFVSWPSRRLALLGILGNLGLVALWTVSRTVGLPFGPDPGQAEAIGFIDFLSTVLEALTVVAVALAWRSLRSYEASSEWRSPRRLRTFPQELLDTGIGQRRM